VTDIAAVREKLANVAEALAREQKREIDRHKSEYEQLARPDFIWHYLVQSFATMGKAAG